LPGSWTGAAGKDHKGRNKHRRGKERDAITALKKKLQLKTTCCPLIAEKRFRLPA
jgi:hypothetical protein